jgi:tRNA (guanine37-N1)-methyltransferase
MKGYDLLGNIAIVKFGRKDSARKKKKEAAEFLKRYKNIKTILEKSGKFKGRLRTPTTKFISGEKTKEALYKENGCVFRFNVDNCYFSPRLASERKEIAEMAKKGESVLVLFGGVAPYAIVIGKTGKPKKIISIELGRECCKYALENIKKNKLSELIEIVQRDVRKKLPSIKEKFDRIVMPRPNLKGSFLEVVFPKIKKKGIIHYYGFYKEDKLDELKKLLEEKAKKAKRKIKIIRIKKAGDIGVREYRYRADIQVLN